ncbi:hypothetical protein [Cloacibacillus sp. An23]|uniref:hypothetical protein n=1 Tax=Cloacibacillus sp. An23 TaxID=1965591 RepID=UPI000B38F42B|nr:hypothetical protein [Cloacibacillus sp. An23]OUO93790.1 hypothetical protein B5F39_06320 [Cloacibacillus sp. An23]
MLKNKIYRKWAVHFLSIFAIVTAVTMAINYAVDPMWCFDHETPFAVWREVIDEREQKTNLLRFRDFDIDALVIGSSRVMQIDPEQVGENAFNMGFSACMPLEYPTLMEVFYRTKRHYPKKILVGLDFFGAGVNYASGDSENRALQSLAQLNENAFVYKLEKLASIELARKSVNLIRKNMKIDEDGIAYADIKYSSGYMGTKAYYPPAADIEQKKSMCRSIYYDFMKIYEFFEYSEHYKEYLSSLIKPPVNAEVMPFVTPEGTLTMRLIAKTPGRLDDYERMLRESVEVFGGVWNFMYVNSVTSNHEYWREPSHCLDQVNEWVLERMLGTGNPPSDFGVYVTRENIDEHVKEVRAQLIALRETKDSWDTFMDE